MSCLWYEYFSIVLIFFMQCFKFRLNNYICHVLLIFSISLSVSAFINWISSLRKHCLFSPLLFIYVSNSLWTHEYSFYFMDYSQTQLLFILLLKLFQLWLLKVLSVWLLCALNLFPLFLLSSSVLFYSCRSYKIISTENK